MDFLSSDISEAIYVYSDPAVVTDQLSGDPKWPAGANPVLAFWRLDPVDDVSAIGDCSTKGKKENECLALKVRQATYTLVVYLHQANTGNDIWQGQSRIIRYSLPKYQGDIANLDQRGGYRDPSLPGLGTGNTFPGWQVDGSPEGDSAVLVDYVSAPNAIDNTCDLDKDGVDDGPALSEAFPPTSNSFYTCIRNREDATGAETNQSLVVYLQGNATDDGATFVTGPISDQSRLPRLESEVLIRGVIEKKAESK
jgi:hypothetical protein